MVRKILGSIFGLALLSLGIWWGYDQLFFYEVIRSTTITAAAFMVLMGGYVLWAILIEGRRKQ